MGETLLSLRGLSIEFVRGSDRRQILDGIDIDVARDRVLGILGESGSGMTTLAKAMVGWVGEPLHVTGGEVLYRSRDLRDLRVQREVRSKIGFIGADPGNAFDPTLP
ncbi:MAG: peptide/nickel transport system ATP-binding protein ddpF, partial [Acetobacteraceae bacterium]|nr:peptide/nickel transport system ATP-binding protein ddpF [Acetobacteraceae bacterium]